MQEGFSYLTSIGTRWVQSELGRKWRIFFWRIAKLSHFGFSSQTSCRFSLLIKDDKHNTCFLIIKTTLLYNKNHPSRTLHHVVHYS